jgi:hypothetical protein
MTLEFVSGDVTVNRVIEQEAPFFDAFEFFPTGTALIQIRYSTCPVRLDILPVYLTLGLLMLLLHLGLPGHRSRPDPGAVWGCCQSSAA